MKAIVQDTYGSADVLKLRDIDRPVVGEDGVLIRVHAAGAHLGDWHVMTGLPYLVRLGFGFRAPKVRVRGIDVAGLVEAVGQNVTQFKPGDAVFGTCDGSFAEYTCVRQDKVAIKPENLTFEEAAAVPVSAIAALQALRDKGGIEPGQKVLIVGASGGVGTYAVQLAKAFGAHVTGVCSTAKADLVRSIGADDVIDYTQDDIAGMGPRYDLILDIAGNTSLSLLRRALTARGTLVLVGAEGGGRLFGRVDRLFRTILLSPFASQKLRSLISTERKEDLLFLKELIEAGKIMPVVGKTYPLSEVPEAMRYLEEGHTRGKVVITVQERSADVRPGPSQPRTRPSSALPSAQIALTPRRSSRP